MITDLRQEDEKPPLGGLGVMLRQEIISLSLHLPALASATLNLPREHRPLNPPGGTFDSGRRRTDNNKKADF